MTALVSGSYAFDHIMLFDDDFERHILPEKVHALNVAFLVPSLRKEYGGCAGNIAYNLNMLGGNVTPMGTVGEDFDHYRKWLNHCGINDAHVTKIAGTLTAQAFITTDKSDNQITAFHPGAMNAAHTQSVADVSGVKIGMVSPDGRDAMIQRAKEFADAGIPFFFDPGQGLPMFGKEDLLTFLQQATYLIVNDYEAAMFCERTELSENEIAAQVEAFIITRGSEGSEIFVDDERITVGVLSTDNAVDPTGCGDAYRAGILLGMERGCSWKTCGEIGALIAGIKVQHPGTQNHSISADEFAQAFAAEYGYSF